MHHWRYDARVYACVKRMCVPSIQHDTPRWWSACMYTPPKGRRLLRRGCISK